MFDFVALMTIISGVVAVLIGMAVEIGMISGAQPDMFGLANDASVGGFPLVGKGAILLLIAGSGLVGLGGMLRR